MTTPGGRDRVEESYVTAVRQVRGRVLAFLDQTWDGLPDYRDGQVEAFTRVAVAAVLSGQRTVASLTDAYLSRVLSQLVGQPNVPAGVAAAAVVGAAVRDGAEPSEVYARPFLEVWNALSEGESFDSAKARGKDRLTKLAATDLQLTKMQASRQVLERAQDANPGRNVWHERVLVGDENCALCVVASTQRYKVTELQPIHPGCDCAVRAHVGPDPGQVINSERLEQLHDTLNRELGVSDRGGRAPDYRKIVTTERHGEYGPTLTVARHGFTGPDDVE